MHRSYRLTPSLLLTLLFALLAGTSSAKKKQPDHWVGTWATAPVAAENPGGQFGSPGTGGSTLREIVHVSIGGPLVRIVLTNEFGVDPLTVGAAHIALSAGQSKISLLSANALTFGGQTSIIIPAGGMAVSDPAKLAVAPFSDLAVSLFIPDQSVNQLTFHSFADQTSYLAPGNVVSAASLTDPSSIFSWDFLKGVDVLLSPESAAIVTFGDSITDGAKSTRDANSRWPDLLAYRLQDNKETANLGVLNEGIGGNRVLHDTTWTEGARSFRSRCAQPGGSKVRRRDGRDQRHRSCAGPGQPV